MSNDRRILDKEFKKGLENRVGDFQEDAQEGIDNAKKYLYKTNSDFELMVKEHPKSFVLGAFVGGFIAGTLLSKVSK